jgi:predicted transposase/invertase (TIGR01784 family)
LPKEPELPLYFLEVQFYHLPSVYADLLVKVYSYLKQHDPSQAFCGVVLFADSSLEPTKLAPYQPLLDAGLIRRFYLDEMPEAENAPPGLSILYLIREAESRAGMMARGLVARAKAEIEDEALRSDLLEFIETVILYKIPRLTRKEIRTMLELHDIRESRAYQEAMQEGREQTISILKMAAQKVPTAEIAAALKLDVELVNRVLAETSARKPRKKRNQR